MKMRPWLIGCLAAVVIVLVGGGAAAYFLLVRPAMAVAAVGRDLARIPQIEAGVRNRAVHQAPADGLLEPAQLERYLAVTRQISSGLTVRMQEFERRYAEISTIEGRPSLGQIRQLASAWSDLLRLVVQAKETQVEALNAQGFSLAEYAWVRGEVIRAAGLAYAEVDFAALLSAAMNDGAAPGSTTPEPRLPVPQANIDLVQPHVDELQQVLPLAAFGL